MIRCMRGRVGLASLFLLYKLEVVFLRNDPWPISRESDLTLAQLELQNNRRDNVDRRGDETKPCCCALGASRSGTWRRVNAG